PGSILGWGTSYFGMFEEEFFALRECNRVRRDGAETDNLRTWNSNQLVLYGKYCLCDNLKIAFEQEVVHTDHGTRKSLFDGSKQRIRGAFSNGGESGVEGRTRYGCDFFAKQLYGRSLAECSSFTLKRHSDRPRTRRIVFAVRSQCGPHFSS